MLLLRLSGHSCAGKTRLVDALPLYGLSIAKVLRYTSREPRQNEKEGEDYFFRKWEEITALDEDRYLVGRVRNMLQAFDLDQIEKQLRENDLVLIEIYPDLWPALLSRLDKRCKERIDTASVFMTAVDPEAIKKFRKKEEKAGFITSEVYKMLLFRNKDEIEDMKIRAFSAANEIMEALSPTGRRQYNKIIHSSPEGPDGMDDWTREGKPTGQAKQAILEFIELFHQLASS
jgi:guanylate kinase